jgi:predicted DsbA family dithiol-disulfide isomerase
MALLQDDHDIGKLEILLQIAEKLGLNSKDLASGSQVYFYMQKAIHYEEMAIQANVRAVPPCMSNNKVLAIGVQKFLQLQQLLPLL